MKLIKTKLQNGLDFWYREDDKYIGQRIALGKYEEYESILIVNQGAIVAVDVGANIGYYTLLLAKVCKKVYAFEPDKDCFEILKKNVEENKLKNVTLFNKAVGAENKKAMLKRSKTNFGDHRLVDKDCFANARNDVMVACVRLDDVIKDKIDLMKIDVQGYEEKVIEGAKKIIEKYSPTIFVEHNGGSLDFLKSVYKNIFTIDYWFYISKKGVHIDSKTGYADLLLTNKRLSFWNRYKNVQWKKVIKDIMGYGC